MVANVKTMAWFGPTRALQMIDPGPIRNRLQYVSGHAWLYLLNTASTAARLTAWQKTNGWWWGDERTGMAQV